LIILDFNKHIAVVCVPDKHQTTFGSHSPLTPVELKHFPDSLAAKNGGRNGKEGRVFEFDRRKGRG